MIQKIRRKTNEKKNLSYKIPIPYQSLGSFNKEMINLINRFEKEKVFFFFF